MANGENPDRRATVAGLITFVMVGTFVAALLWWVWNN